MSSLDGEGFHTILEATSDSSGDSREPTPNRANSANCASPASSPKPLGTYIMGSCATTTPYAVQLI